MVKTVVDHAPAAQQDFIWRSDAHAWSVVAPFAVAMTFSMMDRMVLALLARPANAPASRSPQSPHHRGSKHPRLFDEISIASRPFQSCKRGQRWFRHQWVARHYNISSSVISSNTDNLDRRAT
jgi:hypothetical protein